MLNRILTGKYYFKKTWCGYVLMLEESYNHYESNGGYITSDKATRFRKDTETEIQNIKVILDGLGN